ncbi:cell wall-binding repeat-containing protein [Herbiconiux liangxiaofengii]|uniref:cell wall-binding repeat-containing protein n=1 Tax=Herbiconiux liangxiaofengii TaxID=3342795 RepID=UPI0035BB0FF0
MTTRSPARSSASFAAGSLAAMIVAGAALVSSAPVSALEVAEPLCPAAHLYKGISMVPSPAFSIQDDHAEVTISAGTLPAGVVLTGDVVARAPYAYSGTPTTTGTYSFTVKATFPSTPAKTVACKLEVGELTMPTRIQGTDRFDQAAKVVASTYTTAETVYLASGEVFADALSAGSVAGVHGAPLLLTKNGELPGVTKAALTSLAPKNIVVVGGPASISPAVFDGLKRDFATADVVRIGGADRFAVSRALIGDADFGVLSSSYLYIATGATFPDALSATPAAVGVKGPVLLVKGSEAALTGDELAVINDLGVTRARIAGGLASVSQGIQDQLVGRDIAVSRSAGATRYDVAVNINAEAFAAADTVYLASGEVFPDALSAGPIAGESSSPIFLAHTNCVPESVLDSIERLAPDHIIVLGGPATLSPDIDHLKPC